MFVLLSAALHFIVFVLIQVYAFLVYCNIVYYIALQCITFFCIALHCIVLHSIALYYISLLSVVLDHIALFCFASYCTILYYIKDKRGYQSIGVAAYQDADEDGIPDLRDGDLNNDGVIDRTVKNDAYLNGEQTTRSQLKYLTQPSK